MDKTEKRHIDRVIYLDGAVSSLEHLVEALERQNSNCYPHAQKYVASALSEARIRLGRALSRRNRCITWHEHIYGTESL